MNSSMNNNNNNQFLLQNNNNNNNVMSQSQHYNNNNNNYNDNYVDQGCISNPREYRQYNYSQEQMNNYNYREAQIMKSDGEQLYGWMATDNGYDGGDIGPLAE